MDRRRLAWEGAVGMRRGTKQLGLGAVALTAAIAVACGSGGSESDLQGDQGAPVVHQDSGQDRRPADAPATEQSVADAEDVQQPSEAEAAAAPVEEGVVNVVSTFLPLDASVTSFGDAVIRDLGPPPHFGRGWGTNFGVSLVLYEEIFSGGVPRDGIPALNDPRFISVAEADAVYADNSPVVQFEVNGDARAYPLDILTWHEIVNDIVGGVPVIVTFCPLCNTAITFERTLGDVTFDFGVSGTLRNSDLIMYDRQTESMWQQIGGKAIVGDMVGARLPILPASIVSWGAFAEQYPEAIVLSRDTGHPRNYGTNPYAGYDDVNNTPFLFRGEIDGQLSAFERVVTLDFPGVVVAYPFSFLEQERVVAERRDGREIVVFWTPGASSALDDRVVEEGRDVGSTGVFEREVDGQLLDFQPDPDDPATFIDVQTQSVWNIFGRAVSGEMAGVDLTPVVHANHFWFAWAAFQPDTEVVGIG